VESESKSPNFKLGDFIDVDPEAQAENRLKCLQINAKLWGG